MQTSPEKKISTCNWIIMAALELIGQIAWAVENSWFNTFVYDTITPDPRPVAWMVAASAITATLTTLIMGIRKLFQKNKLLLELCPCCINLQLHPLIYSWYQQMLRVNMQVLDPDYSRMYKHWPLMQWLLY